MVLPVRLHAWMGTLELDEPRDERSANSPTLSPLALASALHGLVDDPEQLRRLAELFRPHDTPRRMDAPAIVDAAIARARDGRIVARFVDTPSPGPMITRPIVDLARLQDTSAARPDDPPPKKPAPTR